ncbi:MAG: CxxxxCH/CxxCH domain-containing protein, partial [Polyangiaceae bacterium]|nr:CxxxxCH/CxxCH domain-containing protein [Polyangiaceae bacterium]
VWADASLHVDGQVEVANLTCTSCHGDAVQGNVNPPYGTNGESLTTDPAVGAHAAHLAVGTGWHRDVACTDCHTVPVSTLHSNGVTELDWSALASADGALPDYAFGSTTCSAVYCHGATLLGPNPGGVVNRAPDWTLVDGTYDACGTTCHTNPPGGAHASSTACQSCHDQVISGYDPVGKTATWANGALHVNGTVEVSNLTCTSCHGDAVQGNVNPPYGTQGEILTSEAAVGAHEVHLAAGSGWHRDGQCVDCHTVPASTGHSNGVTDFSWGAPASADGASPVYDLVQTSCTDAYCHGATLRPPKAGGAVSRTPDWTTVNGTYDTCGDTCHTNPPGGDHVAHTDCTICHTNVIATFDPGNQTATWANAALHVDGVKQWNDYHDLAQWTAPKGQANHHGSGYFIPNHQRDEHGTLCSDCHGANLDGGTVGVSCNDTSAGCHNGQDWQDCTFCHGTGPAQSNPPLGVADETLTNTLAVGRHVAHLTSNASHVAFACVTCHVVPGAGNTGHAVEYVPSASLSTPGHHGDLAFTLGGTGTTWNVNATQGAPVTARGTCVRACHGNGQGGLPVVTPYWAGGTWPTANVCGNCHAANPNTGEHNKHAGEVGCSACHPGANTSTHMNGTETVNGTINGIPGQGGGSVTTIPPGGACGPEWGCSGNCHGKGHGPRCWN